MNISKQKYGNTQVIPTCTKQRLPEIMTKKQLLKLSRFIDRPDIAMAIWISVFHGLRIGELAEGENKNTNNKEKRLVITKTNPLKWENVSFERFEIKIVNGKNTKRYKSDYGKDRIIPIPQELIGIWKKWRFLNPDAVYVIPKPNDPTKPINKRVLQDNLNNYLEQANLLKVHYLQRNNSPRYTFKFHTMRHMFGVLMLRKGVSIEKLQKLMGHARLETTMTYTKLAINDLHCAVNKAISVKKESSELTTAKELVKTMMEQMLVNKPGRR